MAYMAYRIYWRYSMFSNSEIDLNHLQAENLFEYSHIFFKLI